MVRTSALPINSDLEVSRTVAGVPVPIRIRPSYIALAVIGGALGTAARFVLTEILPRWESLSAGTLVVNLLGPFLLGVLLQSLAHGAETGGRRVSRLLIGTGFLGAFTSYAQLAVDVVTVAEYGNLLLAGVYGLGTIAAGAAATWMGVMASSHWRSPVPPVRDEALR
jgi:CrcB protein